MSGLSSVREAIYRAIGEQLPRTERRLGRDPLADRAMRDARRTRDPGDIAPSSQRRFRHGVDGDGKRRGSSGMGLAIAGTLGAAGVGAAVLANRRKKQ